MKFVILYFISNVFSMTILGQQLVLRGDHAAPSVVKIGDTYWASANTEPGQTYQTSSVYSFTALK